MACIFCAIAALQAPASIIHEEEDLLAFMDIQPVRSGQCMVIPRRHIDHFTDVPDDLSAQIMVVAQRISRKMMQAFRPQRVGMVVHGFGVPHAHLILVPQHGTHDITSASYAQMVDGTISFDKALPFASRETLDQHAQLLRID